MGAHLRGQLAAQLRLQRQLVFSAGRDLAIQLQVVDELEVADLGLIGVALPAVDHGDERRDDGRPQRQDDGEFEKLHPVGENQSRAGRDCQHQQRGQQHPARPSPAAPGARAAGRFRHGGDLTCHRSLRVSTAAAIRRAYTKVG